MNKTNNGHFVIMYSNWGKEREREREREREIIYDLCSDVNVNIFGSLKRFKETLFYF